MLERAKFKAHSLNDYKSAMEDCNRVVLLYPSLCDAYIDRAQVESLINQYDESIKDCDTGIALGSRDEVAYLMRGTVGHLIGNDRRAINDLDTARSIDPWNPDIYETRAAILLVSGDTAGATKVLETYPPSNSNADSLILFQLGVLKLNSRQFADAKKYLEKAVVLQPDVVSRYYYCGIARDSLHDRKGACAMMIKGYKLGSEGADTAFAYVKSFCRGMVSSVQLEVYDEFMTFEDNWFRKDFAAAIANCNRMIVLAPDSAMGYFVRGDAKRAMGNFDEALKDYRQAIRLAPAYPNAYAVAASTCYYLKDMKSARDYNLAALKINPANVPCYYNLGMMAKEAGNYKEAVDYLKNAVNYQYNYPKAWLYLGDCYKETGDKENACYAWHQALAQGETFAKVEIMNACK